MPFTLGSRSRAVHAGDIRAAHVSAFTQRDQSRLVERLRDRFFVGALFSGMRVS